MFTFTKKTKKKIKNVFKTTVAITSSFSIVISSISYSYAQSIIIDPSAPGASFLHTSNLTPQIDIATPQSGVSLNQFSEFNVGADGLILNNSTTGGVSVIGANVTANPNLVSGPANVIVNEVTSAAPSSLTGTTEVFGQSAAVIIANPNGINCNGCSFLNSTSTSLTTGTPIITGAEVDLLATKGTITIGPDGFDAGPQAGLFGRHIIINGPVVTTDENGVLRQTNDNSLVISGGAQRVNGLDFAKLSDTAIVSAPTLATKKSPFAIDASEAGTLSSGNMQIWNHETGLGVNLYGDVNARTISANSYGDLFYQNIDTQYHAIIVGKDVRQYGDLNAKRNVIINADSFTLYDGRKILTENSIVNGDLRGRVNITATDFVVIAGEVSGAEINIDVSTGSLTNTGFLLSDGDLTIVAGENVTQQRGIASEYDIYFDPALQQYLQAYQTQLLSGGAESDIAAEMIARASQHELIAEYIDKGATITGTNVTVTAANDITNTGGAIAATNDVLLTAGNNIINEYLALRSRLNAEDGCPDENCGYRTDFHAGEILAGHDLTLITTAGNIENRASDIAAANNILLSAGQDVVNSLKTSNYDVNDTETVQLIGPGLTSSTSCSAGKDGTCTTSYSVVNSEYSTEQYTFDEENILAPGRIATLYGDVDITAGRDFISIGSEISAGNDLTINAVGQAIMSSFVDAEEDFINRNERYANVSCYDGKNGSGCGGSQGFTNITYDGTVLATATSNLTGRTINITAGDNITLLGARFLASVDLDLTSTNGSVLIDSTDLPDEIELGGSAAVEFIELREDVIAQIFGTANLADEITGLSVFYTNLITDPVAASAAQDNVVSGVLEIILAEVVQVWQEGYDPATPTEISTSLTSLQTDDLRRGALAENLLYIIANELSNEADTLADTTYASLDEYVLLQTLILNGASDSALNTAALSLVGALTASLLAQTIALEAVAVAPATLPERSVEFLELREVTVFDQVFAQLVNATPTEATDTTVSAFEALSIEDNFMQALAINLVNVIATELGRDPLFVADDTGAYDVGDALIDIESDASLQRLVLEMSLILSPGNTEANPTSTELSTLVTVGTSTENNILRIIDELADLSPLITNAVVKLIEERDLKEKSEMVLAQDVTAITIDVSNLLDTVATALGAQALTERQAEVDANTSQYLQFLQGNELLTAVEGLRLAASGADIKDAARNVGVQSYVSLIASTHLDTLQADAAATIVTLHDTIGADIIAHNNTVSSYNEDIKAQLKALTDLLDLSDGELALVIQSQIDALTVAYDTQVATVETEYETQLAANQTQYGHLLTTTTQQTYWTGGKNGHYATRWVTSTNTYYVNLKNTADAQAEADRTAALDVADTQNLIDVALVQSSSTDEALNGQIATLSTDYNTQLDSYTAQKTVLFTSLNTQVSEAMRVAALVTQQKALEESIRTTALAKGSVVEGERSLAVALTTQAFPELGRAQDRFVNNVQPDDSADNWSDATALQYIASHADLAQYVVDNGIANKPAWAREHWNSSGKATGRKITFDALAYLASYDDLRNAFAVSSVGVLIDDFETAAERAAYHYIGNVLTGTETRSVSFDSEAYLRNYADLRNAYGLDYDRATQHYLKWGSWEGRSTSLQDSTISKPELLLGSQLAQDSFINATAWRFATDKALEQLSSTPRTVLLADNDLSVNANKDVYVVGETMIAATNDLSIDAGRRIGLLGAINTNFRLAEATRIGGHVEEQTTIEQQPYYVTVCNSAYGCGGKDGADYSYELHYNDVEITKDVWVSNGIEETYDVAYESFVEIGETLQLGTLQREAYAVELVDGVEAIDGEVKWLNYAQNTQYYDLTSTSLTAGGNLSLNSGGDILNFGGSVLSGENTFITAETDIRNEALRHNFTLTRELGCVGYACGRLGHEYRSGEFLSGSGLIMSAGGDIVNKGSVIAAAGSILADAEGDIVNEALSSQYLYHYINSSSFFGLKRRIEILNRAIISEAEITTEYGDITLNAGNDIRSKGAKISSGGDVALTAGNDILLEAKAEELNNYRKVRKFSGLSYGQTKTYWNEFDTAFSQIEGNSIYLDAGRNVTAIGALLFAAQDIDVVASENITFDAHQNNRYEYTSGWSFGISFGGSQIIEALIEGESLLDAYIATNPTLAAIHQLATADNRDGFINGYVNLGYHLPRLLSGISDRQNDAFREGRDLSLGKALAQELNPFDWLNDNGLFNPTGKNVQDDERKVNKKGFVTGIKFRFGVFKSSNEWTESFVSQLIAGEDLWLDAGKDLSLVGGTVASASENSLLYAGENILVAALSDTTRTSSSGWGLSLGFGASGLSFGFDFNKSTGQSEMFTNAAITAGADLDIISGIDTVLMGANIKARDIYMDVGNDLIVQSRQNTSDSESFGFSFSTDGAFSLNISEAERRYTDTPTTIVAQDRLSIYTGSTTYLLGAVLQSEVGNLELDTGNLIFDNFNELDRSSSFGISGSISVADFAQANATNSEYVNQSDVGGSWAYESTHAITYATVGAGTIRVRDVDDYDFSGLNRDVDHVQVITSHKKFVREIPGINLKRLSKQIQRSVDLIEAYSTHLTDQIRAQGEHAVKLFRESVRQGFDPDELRALASSPEFRAAVRERKNFFEAVEHYGSVEAIPADTKAAIALGYTVLLGKASNYEGGSFVIPCQTSSQKCQIALNSFNLIFESQGVDNILAVLERARVNGVGPGPGIADHLFSNTLSGIVSLLLWCATEYPDVFVQLTNNTAAKPLLQYYGAALGSDTNAFYEIADVINAGGTAEAIQVAYENNVDWNIRTEQELIALNDEYAITTRATGLLQSAFGASEAILGALGTGGCTAGSGGTGVALCTIGGYAVIIHGFDNAATGMDVFISGEGQQTIGADVLQALGDSLGLPQSAIDATILAYDIAGPVGVTGTVAMRGLPRTGVVQDIVDTVRNRTLADAGDIAGIRARHGLGRRDTVAASRTDIPGLEGQTFEGISPGLRRLNGLPSLDDLYGVGRPIKSPNPNPIASRHAEEDVFNGLARQIDNSGLTPAQLNGRTVNIHISNAGGVCNVCYQGLGNSTATPGVIRQFSERYPGVNIRITAERGFVRPGVDVITVRGGQLVD